MKKKIISFAIAFALLSQTMVFAGGLSDLVNSFRTIPAEPHEKVTATVKGEVKAHGAAATDYAATTSVANFDYKASIDMSNVRSAFNTYYGFGKHLADTTYASDFDNSIVTGQFTITFDVPTTVSQSAVAAYPFASLAIPAGPIFDIVSVDSTTTVGKIVYTAKVKDSTPLTVLTLKNNLATYLGDFELEADDLTAASTNALISVSLDGYVNIAEAAPDNTHYATIRFTGGPSTATAYYYTSSGSTAGGVSNNTNNNNNTNTTPGTSTSDNGESKTETSSKTQGNTTTTTSTTTNSDGSSSSTTTTTTVSGNTTTTTSTTTNSDGSSSSTKKTTTKNSDGSTTTNSTTTNSDGSSSSTTTNTTVSGNTTTTTSTTTNSDGSSVNATETTTKNDDGSTTTVTETAATASDGEETAEVVTVTEKVVDGDNVSKGVHRSHTTTTVTLVETKPNDEKPGFIGLGWSTSPFAASNIDYDGTSVLVAEVPTEIVTEITEHTDENGNTTYTETVSEISEPITKYQNYAYMQIPEAFQDTTTEEGLFVHKPYINGYPDGEVKPDNNMTREEVATAFVNILNDAFKEVYATTEQDFPDVASDRWSNDPIALLTNAGILVGDDKGNFNPAKPITRAEFATIASKFVPDAEVATNYFTDIDNHWAKDSILKVFGLGWTKGRGDGTFDPDAPITRAEVMQIINTMWTRFAKYEKSENHWPDLGTNAWYFDTVMDATTENVFARSENGVREVRVD